MYKTLLLLLLFAIGYHQASAQERLPKSDQEDKAAIFSTLPSDLQTRIAHYFDKLAKSNIKDAYSELLAGSPIMDKQDEVKTLVEQTKRSIELYGGLNGFEPVSLERASISFVRLRYVGLHGDVPLRYIFTFYRSPVKGWIVTNFKFDDLSEYFFQDQ
ncbi:MAG: hypothetical protein ACM3U1_08255 [Chloroflexota bacterium]